MQIDFHHAVTYVAARLADFEHEEAITVAHAAQYVDDATSSGVVNFHNQAMYYRISSAHKMIDKRNLSALENHRVWLPFHFLPGNDGKLSGHNHEGDFIHKIVCKPDSPVAQDMVKAAILDHKKPYALQLLGITMHVYADTWAHQGFAGVLHDINEVDDATEIGTSGVFDGFLGDFLRSKLDDLIPPLGHGRANIFPDMPFLSWKYNNGHGKEIKRNNTDDFCAAANAMCKAMQRFRAKNPDAEVAGIADADMAQIRHLFESIKEKDGEKRHKFWLQNIANGYFDAIDAVPLEQISYEPRGRTSWKYAALGSSHDIAVHKYQSNFLKSDWKLFHDALQTHRARLLHDILPPYDICAA